MPIQRRQRKRNPRTDKAQKGERCSLGSGGRSAIAQQQHLDNQVRASKNSRKHLGCSGASGWLWKGARPGAVPARGCSGSCSAGSCLPWLEFLRVHGFPTPERHSGVVSIPWDSHSCWKGSLTTGCDVVGASLGAAQGPPRIWRRESPNLGQKQGWGLLCSLGLPSPRHCSHKYPISHLQSS